MKRYDPNGNQIATSPLEMTECDECGMPVYGMEFHPYEACEVYKRTHDSREVWKALMPRIRERLKPAAPTPAKP
jgi:hypothetical protein